MQLMTDTQLERYERLYDSFRLNYTDPKNAEPKIIIHVPCEGLPRLEEQLADPLVMLNAQLEHIRQHAEIGDDLVPAVRVNFGTAQVAAAFGCELAFPQNNLPAAKTHVLKKAEDVYELQKPSLQAGLFGKLKQWTEIWIENLPDGVQMQHPDIQSPFNTAHLIRGNDIFTDMYDTPESVDALLELVTDYMIELVPVLKEQIKSDREWFFDWGGMWKGTARISNCTSDLIGPDFYRQYVLKHDLRFLRSIGGGRVHCCASSGKVIEAFLDNPEITGLDCDAGIHDVWSLAEKAPEKMTLVMECYGKPFPQIDRLLHGDWPRKRNVILITQADSVAQGKELLGKLRKSIPR
jgi:uroporphyrinogen-III decarboxylase